MFDVGFSELLIIAVVALLVLGPERLPTAARFAGLWVRRARAQWYSVKSELERELANEELKRSLSTPLSDLQPQMRALEKELRDELSGIDTRDIDLRADQPARIEPSAAQDNDAVGDLADSRAETANDGAASPATPTTRDP